jgi:hypothetical protein
MTFSRRHIASLGGVIALAFAPSVHAEERIIGLPSVASKLAQTVIVVDPTTGLPVAGTGGGPATIASGAVVSGAYATGAIVDLGAQSDTSWSGSGNGSLIAIMKAIAAGTAASSTLPIYAQGNTASAVIQGSNSAFLNDAVATSLQIVALSGSTKIYVTSYSIVAAVAENVQFQYGTGSNCGTGTTAITSNMALSANGGIARGSGLGPVFVVPAGNALCVLASTTGPTAVDVSYAQF